MKELPLPQAARRKTQQPHGGQGAAGHPIFLQRQVREDPFFQRKDRQPQAATNVFPDNVIELGNLRRSPIGAKFLLQRLGFHGGNVKYGFLQRIATGVP